MKTIDTTDLVNVSGGVSTRSSSNDAITQSLTTLQSSIKDIANKPKDDNSMLFLVMAMSMNRSSPTVVAGGGAPAYAAGPPVAAGPVINVSTRVRRW